MLTWSLYFELLLLVVELLDEDLEVVEEPGAMVKFP